MAPVINSHLNLGTFSMICMMGREPNQRLVYDYPHITFAPDYNFGSYGSVIKFVERERDDRRTGRNGRDDSTTSIRINPVVPTKPKSQIEPVIEPIPSVGSG